MPLLDIEDDDVIEKNRLFETHQKTKRSLGSYVKVILVVAVGVAIAGGAFMYFTLPGIGDAVLRPAGLEQELRHHMSDVEKRDATDMAYYLCDQFHWVRVGVETRPDIPAKPHNMVDKYRVKASQTADGKWTIAALPILSAEENIPCRF